MEYRFGKFILQIRIQGDKGQFVFMFVDYKLKIKIKRKKLVEEVLQIDFKEQMMKDMFVCLGEISIIEVDVWFISVQIIQNLDIIYFNFVRSKSVEIVRRFNSVRFVSVYSVLEGYYRLESGIGIFVKSFVYSGYYFKVFMENLDDVYLSKLFVVDGKFMIYKFLESVFSVTEDYFNKKLKFFSFIVYIIFKIDFIEVDDELGFEVTDIDFNFFKERQDDFLDEELSVF